MICKACGREKVNDNANFCEYCGTSYREDGSIIQEASSTGMNAQQQNIKEIKNEENEKSISFGNWMGTMFLPLIPFIGIFIYIVMLFVWAFSSDTPESKKNWARATLIITVIGIVLLIFIFSSAMMEIMNSGLSFEEYMAQFYKEM